VSRQSIVSEFLDPLGPLPFIAGVTAVALAVAWAIMGATWSCVDEAADNSGDCRHSMHEYRLTGNSARCVCRRSP
jgi:hypothetical protein